MYKFMKYFAEEELSKQLETLEKEYPNMTVTYSPCPYYEQRVSGTISKVYHCVMIRA